MTDSSRAAKPRKNILHVITTVNKGGAENQLIQLVHGQASRGYKVAVLYLKGDGFWEDFLKRIGVRCYKISDPKILLRLMFMAMRGTLNQIDTVNAHMPPALCVAIPVFRLIYRKRLVFTAHNDERMTRWNKDLDYICGSLALMLASRVVAISESVREFYKRSYSLRGKNIATIPYCWNQAIYDYMNESGMCIDEKCLYKKNMRYIGAIARLEPQKRLDLLISSFATLVNEYEDAENLGLVIVGKGSLEEVLRGKAERLQIAERIIWINESRTPLLHLSKWNYLCLTSEYEGFGLVLLEAVMTGKRVVAMDVSSVREIIGTNGRMVEFGNTRAFAQAMYRELMQELPVRLEDTDSFSLKESLDSYEYQYWPDDI